MTFSASEIAKLQTELTASWHHVGPKAEGEGLIFLIQQNHLRNFQLWHEEDVARRDDLGFEAVYRAKRNIDRFNQERNNFVEEMDQAIVAALQPPTAGCPRNSETPGMMIDRLSILALKEYHMHEEAARTEHRRNIGRSVAKNSPASVCRERISPAALKPCSKRWSHGCERFRSTFSSRCTTTPR